MKKLDFFELCKLYQVPDFIQGDQLSLIAFTKVFKIGVYTIEDYLMTISGGRIKPPGYPNFAIVPCFPRYAVDFMGNVLDTKTWRILPKQKRDYIYVEIFVPSRGEFRTIGVHRLVALAWKVFNVFHSEVEVNHKDGNTYNNNASNLEWVTPLENNRHAVENFLVSENITCKILDIKTQEFKEFPSLKEMTRYIFGPNVSLSKEFFKKSYPESLVRGRFEVKLQGDDSKWFYLGRNDPAPKTRYVVTVEDKHGTTERLYGPKEIRDRFRPKIGSVGVKELCDFVKEKNPDLSFTIEDRSPDIPSQALNVSSFETVEAESGAELARKIGQLKSEVNKRLVHGLKTPLNGWLIRRKTSEAWHKPEEVPNKPRCIKVLDTETGSTTICKSIRETERLLRDFDRFTISSRIADGKPLGKYVLHSLLD